MNDEGKETGKKKRRKPPWVLGGIVLVLLTILVLLQSSNLWKSLTVDSSSDVYLSFVLSSFNFVAFIVFAFIFGRSLLKLLQERKALRIGSKIKTRLLLYFFAIILLPLIVMPGFSYLFMNRAMDRWFTRTPEFVIRRAGDLQQRSSTLILAEVFSGKDVTAVDLQKIIETGSFVRIAIFDGNMRTVVSAEKPLDAEKRTELNKMLGHIVSGKPDDPSFNDGEEIDAVRELMSDGRRLVTFSDKSSAENMSQLVEDSLLQLNDQKKLQESIRRNGLLILAFVSFLLIFAASWMARYVAKGLTRPILALAEGADQITRGNLGYQVDVFADDEIELLVKAFNEMSGKLDENAQELKDRRRYIETVLQSLSTGVISFDDKDRVTTINKAAIQMFKLEGDDFARYDLKQLVNEENEAILKRVISRTKRSGNASEQATLFRENPDGSKAKGGELPVALTACALPNENGVVLVIEDLSELIAAQRASAWREVARRMAHEIKNPLTPIQLSAERIAKRFNSRENGSKTSTSEEIHNSFDASGPLADEHSRKNLSIIKEGTDTILREVSSLKTMVNEFSRFARLPNVKLEAGSVNEVIMQTTLLYSDRISDIKIETVLDSSIPVAMIDHEQLKRVFVNLIDNAVESFENLEREKIIKITTRYDAARELIVAEVTDNGMGLKPRDFQKLFQPYFSTKGRGTGLGLAIVQRIVSEHGGKIRGVSNVPEGAKFIIDIPISSQA